MGMTLHSRANPTTKKILVWICALGLLHTATARRVNEIEVSGASNGCNGTYKRVDPNPNDLDDGVRFQKDDRQIFFKAIKTNQVFCETSECEDGKVPGWLVGKKTCSECKGAGYVIQETE